MNPLCCGLSLTPGTTVIVWINLKIISLFGNTVNRKIYAPILFFTPFALIVKLSEFQYLILSLMKHNWLSGRILVLVKSCTKWRRAKSHGVKKLYTLYTALQLAYKPFPLNFNRHKHKCSQMPLVIDNSNTCIFMQVRQIRCWTLVEFICGFFQKWGG